MASGEVLIVGGGPVGLALGCFLQLHNVKNKIIEKKIYKNTLSKAAGLQPNSIELFEPLQITNELIARSNPTYNMSFIKGGNKILNLNLSKQATKYPGMYIIGQNEVEEVLRSKYLQMGGELLMGAALKSILQHAENQEKVSCEYDLGKTRKKETFSFIVGCDGLNSTVRSLMEINFNHISNSNRYLIIEGKLDIDIENDSTYCFINEHNQPFAVVPMRDSVYRIVAPFPASVDNVTEYLLANAKLIPFKNIQVLFDKTARISEFIVQKRIAEAYQKGNVFLAGDAAHVHSPAGAQGMNTGIADAHNLSIKIANVLRKSAPRSSLKDYYSERYPVAEKMIKGIDKAINLVMQSSYLKSLFLKFLFLFRHDQIVNQIAQLNRLK